MARPFAKVGQMPMRLAMTKVYLRCFRRCEQLGFHVFTDVGARCSYLSMGQSMDRPVLRCTGFLIECPYPIAKIVVPPFRRDIRKTGRRHCAV